MRTAAFLVLVLSAGVAIQAEPTPAVEPAALEAALKSTGAEVGALRTLFERDGKPVLGANVPGAKAIELWRKARAAVDATGWWPVLLGAAVGVPEALEGEKIPTVAEVLAQAGKVDVKAWLTAPSGEEEEEEEEAGPDRGEWPADAKPNDEFLIPLDVLSKQPLPEVVLGFVPTRSCWEVPAWLVYGGWNECPMPEVHVALMKRWHETYGAEVVGMAGDVVEMQVARPPKDKAAALALAGEQYRYCCDIVDQGTGTLEGLAAVLQNGRVWYFWWD